MIHHLKTGGHTHTVDGNIIAAMKCVTGKTKKQGYMLGRYENNIMGVSITQIPILTSTKHLRKHLNIKGMKFIGLL